MPHPAFQETEACVFDAYGTLFDVHSAAARMKDELGTKAHLLSEMWRRKQLEYTWLRSLMGRYDNFWQITRDALDYSMSALDIEKPGIRAKLMELYLQLDSYPEVSDTLERLKKAGKKIAILSNGEPSMLIAAAKSSNIYPLVDKIFSVESVGIFKPHPTAYQLAVDGLKIPANRISFQSANGWDAHGGCAFGFVVAWINRQKQPVEHLPSKPQTEITTLSDLPELMGL
ncbi:MAG: haloacid dehalogenase type II [Pseudomonadota bacterium]|nr:haloacid dehalogenase type II [Pseudomonadota bacterium]